MTDSSQPYAVVSLRDVELEGQVSCAQRRLVVIAPGFSESVAKAIVKKWHELGRHAVQVVLDADPEVCRLGLGDLSALQILHEAAGKMGVQIHHQPGLRVGVIITDETTSIYSPSPRLIEAGGQAGERLNGLRFDAPVADTPGYTGSIDLRSINLKSEPLNRDDVQNTVEALEANPPMKFDVARKVRVFNAQFEFVEFEMHGLALSRKRVPIPSDLMGLAKDSQAQQLLRSSFQLVGEMNEVSGDRVARLKKFIVKDNLIALPGYGTVILRNRKERFQDAVKALERYIHRFQRRLKRKLQTAIDTNREVVTAALLPGELENAPVRWNKFIGEGTRDQDIEAMLRLELKSVFGQSDDLFADMSVKVIFKGVTYELLNDPAFMRVASEKIPALDRLHGEFDAAKAEAPTHPR